MKSEQIEAFLEMMQEVEQYRPVVKFVIEQIKSFGPDVKDLTQTIALGIADINSETFYRYVKNGLEREEALALVISTNTTFTKALQNANKK